jgi:hypothetical protein
VEHPTVEFNWLLVVDDILNRKVGWGCNACHTNWFVGLNGVKGDLLSRFVKTPKDREVFGYSNLTLQGSVDSFNLIAQAVQYTNDREDPTVNVRKLIPQQVLSNLDGFISKPKFHFWIWIKNLFSFKSKSESVSEPVETRFWTNLGWKLFAPDSERLEFEDLYTKIHHKEDPN